MICLGLSSPTFAKRKKVRKSRSAQKLQKKMRSNKYGALGMRVGVNFAGLDQSKNDQLISNPSSSAGLGLGIVFDKALNEVAGFRVEALYQNKNFTHKSVGQYDLGSGLTLDNDAVKTETFLDYVEIPLLFVVRLNPGKQLRPFLNGGFYGAALVNTSGVHEGEGENKESRLPFSSFDYGWVAGAGAYFAVAGDAGAVSFELRYSQSLANIADNDVEISKADGSKITPLDKSIYGLGNFSLLLSYYF